MKNYKITEDQIKQLAKGNKKVEKMFPEVFETEIELNKWYKREDCPGSIVFINKKLRENIYSGYGISGGEWIDVYKVDNYLFKCIPSTEEEVKEALIKEAEKRGFKPRVKFNPLGMDGSSVEYYDKSFLGFDSFFFDKHENSLGVTGFRIFINGIWADIIKEKYYTIDQAEKRLTELENDGFDYKIID